LVPLEPEGVLLAVEPVSLEPELPLEDEAEGEELELPDWSLLLDDEEGELELGVLELELPLSFFARLPDDEPDDEPEGLDGDDEAMPDEPEEPDCERRESLPRSQAESAKLAAIAAAAAVRKNLFCSMSTIS
jgi:hypothetical protein